MKKIFKKLIFGLIITSLLLGCQKEIDTSDKQTTEPMKFEELTEIKEDRLNIYVIVKLYESSYWQVVLDGVKDAGNDLDCNIYAAGGNAESEWKLQEKLIEEACSRGADAIILAADDAEQLADATSKAKKQGIHIILIDSVVNTEDYDICYMTDNLMAGQNAAEELIRLLKEKGISEDEAAQIAIQVGSSFSQTINERLAGFSQYWTKYAPDKWVIIDDIKINDGDESVAAKNAEEFFNTYPDIKGVFATNNGSTVGFAKTIYEYEKTDICMVGFDYSDAIKTLIESDDYDVSTVLQQQYNMGYFGVDSALKFIDGETTDVKFIDTGVKIVNKESLNEPDIQEIIKHN